MRQSFRRTMNRSLTMLFFSFLVVSASVFSCEEHVTSFTAKVVREKVLCISSGVCVQEISAKFGESTMAITNSKKPWVEEGDMVTILKLKGLYLPSRPRGRGQSYSYKLARFCEAS